jgi:ribosomal protein S18 acetylase RimI-like enzyme
MDIEIRQATEADKEFLIESIIEAEKSGSDIISYCAIFSITEEDFRTALSGMLDEDMEGQELNISGFLIAEVEGEKAAALNTWVENASGMSSSMIKSNLLMYFLDRQAIINAAPAMALMNEVNIHRDSGALQIESVYTTEKYRGLGLSSKLINEHIRLKQALGVPFNKVQVILLKNNKAAQKAYQKAGFTVVAEKRCTNPTILNLMPCDTKILMEKELI